MKYDFHPLSPEIYDVVHSSPEKIEGFMWLGRGNSGPPIHHHPNLQEELEIISGKLKIYRDGEWQIVSAGAKWIIAPNEIHTFKTIPNFDVKVKFCATPALGFEGFLKDTQALVQSGKLISYESINGLIYSSMLISKYADTLYPSQFGMKIIVRIANFIGNITGKTI